MAATNWKQFWFHLWHLLFKCNLPWHVPVDWELHHHLVCLGFYHSADPSFTLLWEVLTENSPLLIHLHPVTLSTHWWCSKITQMHGRQLFKNRRRRFLHFLVPAISYHTSIRPNIFFERLDRRIYTFFQNWSYCVNSNAKRWNIYLLKYLCCFSRRYLVLWKLCPLFVQYFADILLM